MGERDSARLRDAAAEDRVVPDGVHRPGVEQEFPQRYLVPIEGGDLFLK